MRATLNYEEHPRAMEPYQDTYSQHSIIILHVIFGVASRLKHASNIALTNTTASDGSMPKHTCAPQQCQNANCLSTTSTPRPNEQYHIKNHACKNKHHTTYTHTSQHGLSTGYGGATIPKIATS